MVSLMFTSSLSHERVVRAAHFDQRYHLGTRKNVFGLARHSAQRIEKTPSKREPREFIAETPGRRLRRDDAVKAGSKVIMTKVSVFGSTAPSCGGPSPRT